ncbi:MAG: DEAD/DEAH box helicase [Promethearchaeota archaeon]|nr:MAG: DEAD/DEAH box helicase [Candidatus Lokiarchaeota archaeon]
MVDFEQFLEYIKSQDFYSEQISYIQHIPAKKAEFGKLNQPLRKRLQRWLTNNSIELWGHQAEAINHISEGKNTVIVTSTASGKSLVYNLSVLNSILENEKTTALYIFPTKALARDQLAILRMLFSETNIKQSRGGIYDGDVESNEKRQVLSNANIIITNPYGLHFYLPWFKQKWQRICKNLKYIVLDEIHIYRGIFGSNFALLIRRLKRILELYNVKPIWILASATINNAKHFAEKLVGEEFFIIDKDDSPSGAKKVILWDLPYDNISGKYRSAHQETKNLFINHLQKNIQTLTFTLSRKMAELQAIWTREALPTLKDKIFSYRAGISKNKRREIEKNFKSKKILGISSTNALELGIDIGSLDSTISSGFPGTLSSFRQQIGRSGRGEALSISTLVPMPNPLDLFYIHNPEILFGPIKEEVLITLNNKYILKNHLCCAAKEIPLQLTDYPKFGILDKKIFEQALEELVSESLLMKRGDKYYWKGEFFPNERFGINNLSDKSYKVILRGFGKEEFLTIEDESYVFRDLHHGAVYLYEAETYIVEEIDFEMRKVFITRANVDFYTQSLKHTEITPIEILSEKATGPNNQIKAYFGNVKVQHEYYSYKVIDTLTQEIRSRFPLEDIPIIEFESQALWFLIPYEFQKELEMKGHDLGGTVHAIEHAMIAMAPALAQISRWDLGGLSIDFDPVKQQPLIYIYDAYKGGIGIAESLYEDLVDLLDLTHRLIESCSCNEPNGCPGCIMSPKCGSNNEPLDKKGALLLLKKLLDIKI